MPERGGRCGGRGPERDLYVGADHQTRIVKVTPAGEVTHIAGTGRKATPETAGRPPGPRCTWNTLAWPSMPTATSTSLNTTTTSFPRSIRTASSPIAGTGEPGFSGDGGPAVKAQLNGPTTVALDGKGNLYISDVENHRIRRIDTNGIITTVAGNGKRGFPDEATIAT